MDRSQARLSFGSRPLPAGFSAVVVVAPGCERVYDEAEWRDAIVRVQRGEIGLCGVGGPRRYFGCGDVLALDGIALRALHNRGVEPAVLVAVSRSDSFPADSSSHQPQAFDDARSEPS